MNLARADEHSLLVKAGLIHCEIRGHLSLAQSWLGPGSKLVPNRITQQNLAKSSWGAFGLYLAWTWLRSFAKPIKPGLIVLASFGKRTNPNKPKTNQSESSHIEPCSSLY